VLTVGVDLAAEAVNTAVARMAWRDGAAEVESVTVGTDDATIAAAIGVADKAGIDCPLGWPRRFVKFVVQHQAAELVAPVDVAGREWRRQLAWRDTDLATRAATGLVPLSVATDRIGLAAMRCAALLARLASEGRPVDRTGVGVVVEVYPAAALRHWRLTHRGYKGNANTAVRHQLVDGLVAAAPWLRLGTAEELCRQSDHALDAVVAALNARAAALGRATTPSTEAAATEGWIALPTCDLAELVD
jgi:predicted nuclease with RNAse H fold